MLGDPIWAWMSRWTWLTSTACHSSHLRLVAKSRANHTFGSIVTDMLARFIPRASHRSALASPPRPNGAQYPVRSCATQARSFPLLRPGSRLSRSPSAPWQPIKLIVNARMSTRSSPPRPPYSHFARQHQARQQHHATRNRNLLLYSTAVVRVLISLSVLMIHLPVYI